METSRWHTRRPFNKAYIISGTRKDFSLISRWAAQAFAFFDPIYKGGEVVGYLCSAKRRLPEADTLVGYAILHRAIRTFQNEGKATLSFGLSPLCGIEDKELSSNRLVSFGFRAVYRSRLFCPSATPSSATPPGHWMRVSRHSCSRVPRPSTSASAACRRGQKRSDDGRRTPRSTPAI